jgi:hypothetical protein
MMLKVAPKCLGLPLSKRKVQPQVCVSSFFGWSVRSFWPRSGTYEGAVFCLIGHECELGRSVI